MILQKFFDHIVWYTGWGEQTDALSFVVVPGAVAVVSSSHLTVVEMKSEIWICVVPTLEFDIDVAPWIDEASGKFDKNGKRSPLKCENLCGKV